MKRSQMSIFFLLGLCHYFCDSMIAIFPILKTLKAIDPATAGMIGGFGATVGESLQLYFGTLCDRGWTKTLVICSMGLASCALLLPLLDAPWALAACFLLVAIGSAAFHPAAASWIASTSTDHNATGRISQFWAFGNIGCATSPLIFATLFSMWGLSIAWGVLLCLLLIIPLIKQTAHTVPQERVSIKDLSQLLKEQSVRHLYLFILCCQTIYWTLMFFLPELLRQLGYSHWLIFGGGHLFYLGGAAVAVLANGQLAARWPLPRLLISLTLFNGICLLLLFTGPPMGPLLLALIGGGFGMINPLGLSLGHTLVPSRRGTISGLLMGGVWCVAEGLGPGLTGVLLHYFPIVQTIGISVAVLFAIAIVFALRINKGEQGGRHLHAHLRASRGNL